MENRLEFLKHVYLFRNVSDECLKELLQAMKTRRFKKGEAIIREGEKGNTLFVLFEGKVTVTKKMTLFADDDTMSRVDKALIRLKDTDYAFFGEMALCGEAEERSATVIADTDCVLGEIAAQDIYDMVEKDARFGILFYRNLAKVLADRLRKANRDILKLTTALTLALET